MPARSGATPRPALGGCLGGLLAGGRRAGGKVPEAGGGRAGGGSLGLSGSTCVQRQMQLLSRQASVGASGKPPRREGLRSRARREVRHGVWLPVCLGRLERPPAQAEATQFFSHRTAVSARRVSGGLRMRSQAGCLVCSSVCLFCSLQIEARSGRKNGERLTREEGEERTKAAQAEWQRQAAAAVWRQGEGRSRCAGERAVSS